MSGCYQFEVVVEAGVVVVAVGLAICRVGCRGLFPLPHPLPLLEDHFVWPSLGWPPVMFQQIS